MALRLSEDGKAVIEELRKRKSWDHDAMAWWKQAKVSEKTLERFRAGQSVRTPNFINLCKAVGANWEEVMDSSETADRSDESSEDEAGAIALSPDNPFEYGSPVGPEGFYG